MRLKTNYQIIALVIISSFLITGFIIKDDIKSLVHKENLSSLTITDLTYVHTNDCIYTVNNNFKITGTDPYIVITDVNSFLNNVKLICNGSFKTIAVYYDLGTGFLEQNSRYVPLDSEYTNINLSLLKNVVNIRIDFEDIQETETLVTISSIELNSEYVYHLNEMIFIFLINILILSLNLNLLKKNDKTWKVINMVLLCITLYCLDYIIIINIPFYLKLMTFILVLIFNSVLIFTKKEVNQNEITV